MVAHPGAQGRAGRIRPFNIAQGRPLNRPRPLRVEAGEEGRPITVWLAGRRCAVEAVLDTWRIDDEWWRQRPVSRLYYRLALADGRTPIVYRNLVNFHWFRQAY